MEDSDRFEVWIARLQDGDPEAARRVWNRFSTKLLSLVQNRLGTRRRPRHADEEDVVNSAMGSLCRRAEQGEFPLLRDELDLWKLLVTITHRKALNLLRDESRQKRGGNVVRGDSALHWGPDARGGFDLLPSPEPTPEFAAMMLEATETLLGMLDPEAQQIAGLRLDGYTNQEIAQRIGKSLPTVERRLKLIRGLWSDWGNSRDPMDGAL